MDHEVRSPSMTAPYTAKKVARSVPLNSVRIWGVCEDGFLYHAKHVVRPLHELRDGGHSVVRDIAMVCHCVQPRARTS